jgi:UPF0716 family protein affecting phage T7 exclusion
MKASNILTIATVITGVLSFVCVVCALTYLPRPVWFLIGAVVGVFATRHLWRITALLMSQELQEGQQKEVQS